MVRDVGLRNRLLHAGGDPMRRIQIALVVWLTFFLSLSLAGQQNASSSPQAVALLQKSLATLTSGQSITVVTLSGTSTLGAL